MTRRRCLLGLAAMAAAGCRRTAPPAAGSTETFVHPRGLALTVPRAIGGRAVAVETTPAGFVVRCAPPQPRYSNHVTVQLQAGVPAPPGAWPKTRTVGGAAVHHAVLELGAGSGGTEYELRAWSRARDGHLLFVQREQSESGAPDFALAWTVIEGTKLSP